MQAYHFLIRALGHVCRPSLGFFPLLETRRSLITQLGERCVSPFYCQCRQHPTVCRPMISSSCKTIGASTANAFPSAEGTGPRILSAQTSSGPLFASCSHLPLQDLCTQYPQRRAQRSSQHLWTAAPSQHQPMTVVVADHRRKQDLCLDTLPGPRSLPQLDLLAGAC